MPDEEGRVAEVEELAGENAVARGAGNGTGARARTRTRAGADPRNGVDVDVDVGVEVDIGGNVPGGNDHRGRSRATATAAAVVDGGDLIAPPLASGRTYLNAYRHYIYAIPGSVALLLVIYLLYDNSVVRILRRRSPIQSSPVQYLNNECLAVKTQIKKIIIQFLVDIIQVLLSF